MIAKGNRDHIRLKMQDNPDGVEARELGPRIYLIKSGLMSICLQFLLREYSNRCGRIQE